jgi:outer membrane lipoprotein-sorting protein
MFFIAWLIWAWTGPAQNDPAAEKYLDEVSRKFQTYKNVKIEFDYELYNPEAQVKQNTNGRVYVQGNRFRAEYMGIIDIFDGHKRYIIVPENKEVNVGSLQNEDGELSPAEIFDFYKKGYRYKMDIKQPVQGRMIQYIRLFPIDPESDISYILLGIDNKTKNIYKVIIVQKDKTRITIYIRKFSVNQPLNDKIFTFDREKYKDYYLNELD